MRQQVEYGGAIGVLPVALRIQLLFCQTPADCGVQYRHRAAWIHHTRTVYDGAGQPGHLDALDAVGLYAIGMNPLQLIAVGCARRTRPDDVHHVPHSDPRHLQSMHACRALAGKHPFRMLVRQ